MSATSFSAAKRDKIFFRDHGICAECGLDCRVLALRIGVMSSWEERRAAEDMLEEQFGFTRPQSSFWEADHIVPLAEGGPDTMENIQTLCQGCHQDKTSEQAKRKAKQRRLLGEKWLMDEARKRG